MGGFSPDADALDVGPPDPIICAFPNGQYDELAKKFSSGSGLTGYQFGHPSKRDAKFRVMVAPNVFSALYYAFNWLVANKETATIVPECLQSGVYVVSVSTARPESKPDAVFAVGSGEGKEPIKFYPCKQHNTPLEEALFTIMNMMSFRLSHGMWSYLEEENRCQGPLWNGEA